MNDQALTDYRNIDLWNKLSLVHEIEILKEDRKDYMVYTKSGKSIIHIPVNNRDPASFTHELLHIDLKTKGIFIGGGLYLSIRGSELLSPIISEGLIEHIGNCLEHIKMLPEFIKLGYKAADFISDYDTDKLPDEIIDLLKICLTPSYYSEKTYNSIFIDLYIGKYFAAISCPNETFNYTRKLTALKNIEPELFDILQTFIYAWNNFDIEDKDPLTGSYQQFLFEFIENLEKWASGKAII